MTLVHVMGMAQDPYSVDERFRFVRSLIKTGNQEAARTELNSILGLSPSLRERDEANFLMGKTYRSDSDFVRMESALEAVNDQDSKRYVIASLMLGESWLRSHRLEAFKLHFDPLREMEIGAESKSYVNLEIAAWYLLSGQVSTFEDFVDKAEFTMPDCRLATEQMKYELKVFQSRSRKSPVISGLLSAVIPGAGKSYLGHHGVAVTNLLTAAALGFTAYEGYRKGGADSFQFLLFTGGFIIFQTATIYGSVQQTKRYNLGISTDFRNQVVAHLSVPLQQFFGH